jgi:hypothetical protein
MDLSVNTFYRSIIGLVSFDPIIAGITVDSSEHLPDRTVVEIKAPLPKLVEGFGVRAYNVLHPAG